MLPIYICKEIEHAEYRIEAQLHMASSSVPRYEVFLSSSSKDADNFSYLLHKGLEDKGILTLRGNQEVEGGGIASVDVIRQLRFAIVIISPDYASSPPLLQELVQILQANDLYGLKVLPVFHLVNPSDVRHQKGTIGESLEKHVQYQVEEINRWTQALTTVADLSGWNTGDFEDQTQLIKAIVKLVPRIVKRDKHPSDPTPQRTKKNKPFEKPDVRRFIRRSLSDLGRFISRSQPDVRRADEQIIEQPVDEVTSNIGVEEQIIQPLVDVVTSIGVNGHINEREEQMGTAHATSSAEWKFLLCTLGLEIFSAGFDQASSPSKPHYALIGMLLAVAAVFTCIWELILKKSLVLESWQKLRWIYYLRPSNTFFESYLDIYGVLSSTCQCAFSIVEYIYFFHHADSPIRLSALAALHLMCLGCSRLCKNRRRERLPL